MSVQWYDSIAKKLGGYKQNWQQHYLGLSGEKIFEERLKALLPYAEKVLDAGCGHGDFTIDMSRYAREITGIDYSIEMIRIAQQRLEENATENLSFQYATTKEELPFKNDVFDLIYSRRGPTSIINHSRVLRRGGTIMGIHNGSLEKVKERLADHNFKDIEIDEYTTDVVFPTNEDFANYLTRIPGNPDYTQEHYSKELTECIDSKKTDKGIVIEEWKYIWTARKP